MNLVVTFVFLLLAAVSPVRAQMPADDDTGPVSEAYLARAGADGLAGEPAADFVTTDVPIFCVVRLVSPETATVRMNLIAVSVAGVKPETKVVSTTYTTKEGQNIVNFTGKPAGDWVAGKYRADIFVDNELAKSLVFDVRKAAAPARQGNFLTVSSPSAKPRPRRKN